jgi:hypothetical protein
MTILDEVQTSSRQHAEGAGLSSGDLIVAAAGQPVSGADGRTLQVVFTPEIEGK